MPDALLTLALALTACGVPAIVAWRAGYNRGHADALARAERFRRAVQGVDR